MSEPRPSLRDLFDLALALPESERPAYVERLATTYPELARDLEALLQADAAAGTFLATPAASQLPLFSSDLAGHTLGPYRVLSLLGSGGMGTVYLAERVDQTFERRVAIKVVRLGFGIEERIARFQRERNILAQLDHPNIARLIDGGTLGGGVPYLVMEYVEGRPIDVYCREQSPGLTAILRLFIRACAAVQFAHQRLVIHRDIKPTNILVGADGEPKLLDFGIATILDAAGADQDQLTQTGAFVVTPDYASPEQVCGGEVTTATDVYALGVVLYLLLAGKAPYRITSRVPKEIVRAVCEIDPDPPSDAVMVQEDAFAREPDPKLSRQLRGDLDTIVLKAMHKDPTRRYASPARLAEDLQRHLDGRPVLARPDTIAYRLGKFARRNVAGVALGAALVLAVLVGAVSTIYQAGEATRQRAIAEKRLADIRRLATSFLFEVHDSIARLPGATPARRLVIERGGEYLDRLAAESGGDPALMLELAEAYDRLGDVQGNATVLNLGDDEGALASYRKALAIRDDLVQRGLATPLEATIDDSHARVAEELLGTGRAQEAVGAYMAALALREQRLAASPTSSVAQRGVMEIARRLCSTPGLANGETRLAHCMRARDLLSSLADATPEEVAFRQEVATAQLAVSEAALEVGRHDEAVSAATAAVTAFADHPTAAPPDVRLLRGHGLALGALGSALAARGDPAAFEHFRRGAGELERLRAGEPANARYRADLVRLLQAEARALHRAGDGGAAARVTEQALALVPEGTEGTSRLRDDLRRALAEFRTGQ